MVGKRNGNLKSRNTREPIVSKCIFWEPSHPHAPLDNEHIWGQWLSTYVRSGTNKHHLQATTIGQPGTLHVRETKLRTGDPLRSKLKIVCKACNSGWMSGLQDAAKKILIPLIEGRRTGLAETAQTTIAAWCTMATMTGDYLSHDATAVGISQKERDWFRDHKAPPENWRIWIGHYPGRKGLWNHYVVPILDAKDVLHATTNSLARPNTQTTTFVIGNFFVHAMSGDPPTVARWTWPFGSRISLNLPQIFPPKETFIAWPPQRLTDFEVELVTNAFERVIDGASRSISGRRLF